MIAKIKRKFNMYLAKNGTNIDSDKCAWYIKILGIWLFSPSLYSFYLTQNSICGFSNGIKDM